MKLGTTFIWHGRGLLAAAALGALSTASADTAVTKVHLYVQSGTNVVAPYGNMPCEAVVYSDTSDTVTEPNGHVLNLTYIAASSDYEVSEVFTSQAALDIAYPDGTYQFAPGVTATLTGDLYPPAPLIAGGTWNSVGQMVVDPTTPLVLNAVGFPGYSTSGGLGEVLFSITAASGTEVYSTYSDSLQEPIGGILAFVPVQNLVPGTAYQGVLAYSTFTTSTPAAAAYFSITTFTIVVESAAAAAGPEIMVQPQSATVATGSTASFSCSASGSPTYQWYLNGTPIPGATGSTLVITNAQAASAGTYQCIATNGNGTATSSLASLAVVTTSDPGRLVNISCRAEVGTGGNILIAGFVVGGAGTSGSKTLLLRGSGPALIPFGLTGVLPDPELQLFSGLTLLDSNLGWGGDASIVATAAAVGAFPWPVSSSHDAALVQTLPSGAYTVQVAGESTDTGTGLVEVYDATAAGAYTAASPRIINLSARVQVGQGSNILIVGFTIEGSTSRTVLIRGSGPALAALGVVGSLADPKLQLFSGSTVLASNQGWGGDSAIANTASRVGAFPWTSSASADSAIMVTLPPGSYTAQISGASNDIGVALAEIYEVP